MTRTAAGLIAGVLLVAAPAQAGAASLAGAARTATRHNHDGRQTP